MQTVTQGDVHVGEKSQVIIEKNRKSRYIAFRPHMGRAETFFPGTIVISPVRTSRKSNDGSIIGNAIAEKLGGVAFSSKIQSLSFPVYRPLISTYKMIKVAIINYLQYSM